MTIKFNIKLRQCIRFPLEEFFSISEHRQKHKHWHFYDSIHMNCLTVFWKNSYTNKKNNIYKCVAQEIRQTNKHAEI